VPENWLPENMSSWVSWNDPRWAGWGPLKGDCTPLSGARCCGPLRWAGCGPLNGAAGGAETAGMTEVASWSLPWPPGPGG
jgi:hypothetical protein